MKESKYTIEYKLSGFNVLNDLTRIVKEDYSKENRKRLITIKVRLEDSNSALKLLNDNNIFAERTSKKKCL